MGAKLVSSPQVRNTLEHLVQSGVIDGDKAVAWKAKLKHEQEVKELRAKANEGDVDAMVSLGRLLNNGGAGLAKERTQARVWYERAAGLGALAFYLIENTRGVVRCLLHRGKVVCAPLVLFA